MINGIANWIADMLVFGIAAIVWLLFLAGVFLLFAHIVDRVREWTASR